MVEIKFRWHDMIDQDEYEKAMLAGKLRTPEYKRAREMGYGAFYHPRFRNSIIIERTVPGFGIVEFASNAPKNTMQQHINDIKKHLSSWRIKNIEVITPSRSRQHQKNTIQPKRKSTKKCKCK